MKHYRFFGLLAAMVLMTACGPQTDAPTPTEEVTDVEATPTAAEEIASSDGCEEGFRLFDHEMLINEPTCIPEEPQRVAVLDLSALEFVTAQGIQPVAVLGFGRDFIVRSNPDINVDVEGLTAESTDVGSPVNLETLLETSPDLIIAANWTVPESGIESFGQIAPTVVYDPFSGPENVYHTSVEFTSAALNMVEAGDAMLSEFEARMQAFREVVGEDLETTSISLVNLRNEQIQLHIAGSFGGELVRDLGLSVPEQQREYDIAYVENENEGGTYIVVSEEELPLTDADYIFVWTAAQNVEAEEDARDLLDTLEKDPLWSTLDATQNDQLFVVNSHWQGFGIFEAHAALDDLFTYIAEVDPAEVSPNPLR